MTSYEMTTTAIGRPAFRKFGASGTRFLAEAQGLAALAETGLVRVPEVFAASDSELVTERIERGSVSASGWERLGTQLAALQALDQPCFGFTSDNFCGDTPQPNPRTRDGHAFFAEHRLGYQGRLAYDRGLLEDAALRKLDRLCAKLEALVPAQGPALLHGDLWNGNVLFDEAGEPVLIDPACYWGWPEAEIAMCALFGGFPEDFYASWESSASPAHGWRDRLPVYQLYHLLNHLNLFGGGYHGQVMAVLDRYS